MKEIKDLNHDERKNLAHSLNTKLRPLFPYFNAKVSNLGGDERSTIIITMGFDPKHFWPNGIFDNTRRVIFALDHPTYKLEKWNGFVGFAYNPNWSRRTEKMKFRKCTVKTENDLIKKLTDFYAKNQDFLRVEKEIETDMHYIWALDSDCTMKVTVTDNVPNDDNKILVSGDEGKIYEVYPYELYIEGKEYK